MKKLVILSAIVASGLMVKPASAQIRFGISLHLPVIVAPAPVVDDQFYYLPDVEAYYSVNENCYYYNDGENWISAAYLPGIYRNYDWQHARRFAVNEPRPYLHNDAYRARYGGVEHRDWGRDAHDNRAYANNDRFNHEPSRGNYNDNRGQNDNHWNNNNNRGQQQAQPQQNNNRGNYNNNRGQQQAQPQQNNNRANGNSTTGQQHFADNRVNDNGRNRPVRN